MKMWTKGLGRTEMEMDFRNYEVTTDDGGNICIMGTIKDPVDWEFKSTLTPEDVPGLLKMVFNYSVLKLVAKNLHRYVGYLFNKNKYKSSDDMVDQVNTAYDNMKKRTRPVRRFRG